ncbi:MAG: restriction endonuclease subunit S [Chitinophagaceae bacterium]|nr:MAG: restriction endonuclease subunit S [Chitinophagaceae bacterium]
MSNASKKRLGDIVTFKRGYDLPHHKRNEGVYPVISSGGISGYHAEYKKEGEGLVIGRYGTLGEAYYINGKYWPHNTALYATNFKGNYPKYVYYLMKCLGNLKTADKSTVPGINRNDLHELEVPYIKPPYQKKIADILFLIDAKIELNNCINRELEAKAKTLYDYWFMQFDFPDENGKPYRSGGGKMVWSDELRREVPEGWKAKSLASICYWNKDTLKAKHDFSFIYYLETSGITKNEITTIEKIYPHEKLPSRAKRIVLANDIIYSTVRPNQEHYGIIKEPLINMIVSTGFAVISHKQTPTLNDLIYQFLSTKHIVSYLHTVADSSVSSYPSINPDDIMALHLPWPKDEEILFPLSNKLHAMNSTIHQNQKQNKHLIELRDWLLPMLMNGQVKVSETEEALSMAAED